MTPDAKELLNLSEDDLMERAVSKAVNSHDPHYYKIAAELRLLKNEAEAAKVMVKHSKAMARYTLWVAVFTAIVALATVWTAFHSSH